MALFQKKPQESSNLPIYTMGLNKTILIVGLGNPGKKYLATRHNIGFAAVEEFANKNDFPAWVSKKDLKCEITISTMGDAKVILIKPSTFMNQSGDAVQAVQHYYRVYGPQTLVVYDELAIPLGQLRTRQGGSDAGHNGVKSLITHIGEDFGRLRIGIGSERAKKTETADFVLDKFSKKEQEGLKLILKEATVLITEYIFGGQLPHQTRCVL